ncbi:hypothetical protein BpHYR1_045664 [Brachionus plicatilis]|uniref:Uncharacterized protein n=1 Tax=Brachionus plicatilis TaxID=10195 RepID=A0A3M7PDC7_BRAPC|nr:hypothetical protein BpHYR1_045664 [Brachionus plicatilis]
MKINLKYLEKKTNESNNIFFGIKIWYFYIIYEYILVFIGLFCVKCAFSLKSVLWKIVEVQSFDLIKLVK